MEDMTDFRRQLSSRRPSDWEHLPDFPLYMDQVLSYMERQTVRLDEDDALTASMVNNYAKNALLPRAEGKKYNREHLAYLTFICILKQVMSVRDMDLLIRAELKDDRSVEDGYGAFLDSLDSALTAAAQEMEPYESGADGRRRALRPSELCRRACEPALCGAAPLTGPHSRQSRQGRKGAEGPCVITCCSPIAAATSPRKWPRSWA